MDRMTARQLRDAAERRGYPVSGRQFADYRRAGLLPEPDDEGRWPAEVVERLVRIRQLGKEPGMRSLSRRAIRLWAEAQPITPAALKRAVLHVARTITAPQGKMVRVRRAWRWLGDLEYRTLPPRSRRRADPGEKLLPKHAEWGEILMRAEDEEIARRFGRLAYLAGATMPRGMEPLEFVRDIPFEEVVVLMLIQDLAPVFRQEASPSGGQRVVLRDEGVGECRR